MTHQPTLFDPGPAPIRFGGQTVEPQDVPRLATALDRVYDLMRDGRWRTLKEIALACETSEAGASSRIRDFRKADVRAKYPNKAVNSRRVSGGLWMYQVEV